MKIHTRTLAVFTLTAALTLTATACSGAGGSGTRDVTIAHFHDVAFDPDGALLVGAHTGAYRVDLATDDVSLLGDVTGYRRQLRRRRRDRR